MAILSRYCDEHQAVFCLARKRSKADLMRPTTQLSLMAIGRRNLRARASVGRQRLEKGVM